jgi:hypothetical protein
MRPLRSLAVSGLSNLPDNPTPLPDERDHPCRRVYREHRQVSNWNPTIINPLLMPDTVATVGFVGLFEKV